MNTLKITKWFGFTQLCLGILSTMLALAGLSAAWDFQDRFSQVNPDREAAQTALITGNDADENYLAGVGKMDHKRRRPRIGEYYLAGVRPTIDPSRITIGLLAVDPNNRGLQLTGGIAAIDPTTGGGHYSLEGWAKMVDNTGRIQG
jgi:hypothetical protein